MSVEELNKEQLTELKQNYYCNVVKENEGVSYGELADVDNLVSDKEIKEYYSDTYFVNDDFACSMEKNYMITYHDNCNTKQDGLFAGYDYVCFWIDSKHLGRSDYEEILEKRKEICKLWRL
jgi:hypothetical protein